MSNTKIGLMLQGDIPGLTRTPTVPSIAMLESVARVLARSSRYGQERSIAAAIACDFAREISNYVSDEEVQAFWNMFDAAKQREGRVS
jgi:hypothetical protein